MTSNEEFLTLDEMMERINNYNPGFLEIVRQKFDKAKRVVIYSPRRVKYFFDRGRQGWSDADVWNADSYLARVIADILEWYTTDKSHGVSMRYATEEDNYDTAVENMVAKRNEEYLKYAAIFREFAQEGAAFDEEWQKEWGGVLDKDLKEALHWFADIFQELWD